MYSNLEKGVHFLAMPRTASKATRDALKTRGFEINRGHHDIQMFEEVVKPNDLVITTTRNHFDWFVSFWYLNGCPTKLHDFIKETCRSASWIKRNPDVTRCELYWQFYPKANRILRFTHVEEDLNRVLAERDILAVKMRQNGLKKPRPYQTYYRPPTIQYIETRFKNELRKFRFLFR